MKNKQQLDQTLRDEKQRLQDITIPAEIDLAIFQGVQKAQQIRLRRKRLWRYGATLTASALLIGFFFSIRLSPVVAAYVSHIPGMEKLVELIRDDKGLQRAAEHQMVQNIEASVQEGQISFHVDEVLMDERRMVIFYTLEHEQPDHVLSLDKIELMDVSGQSWGSGISWGSSMDKGSKTKNRVDVTLTEKDVVPDQLQLQVIVAVDQTALDVPIKVAFPIDKAKYSAHKEIVYEVNQVVTVDGQRFTIDKITAYPTQTEVSIQFDPANTKHIFDFDQLALVDEQGHTYSFWGNGVPYTRDGEDVVIYNLESIYFTQPEQLFLQAKQIRALDKEKRHVTIDAHSGTLLSQPDERLRLNALRQNDDIVGMDFSLQVDVHDASRYVSFVSELTDDRGNEYELFQSTSSSDHENELVQVYGKLFKRLTSKGTPAEYRFTLDSYPTRLSNGFRVLVK